MENDLQIRGSYECTDVVSNLLVSLFFPLPFSLSISQCICVCVKENLCESRYNCVFVCERDVEVAVCCSVLHCVAVCCRVCECGYESVLRVMKILKLQCVAACCIVLQCVAVCCRVWQTV